MYRTSRSLFSIEEVAVDSATPAFVVIRGRRKGRTTAWESYHETREGAIQEKYTQLMAALLSAKRRLALALADVTTFEKLHGLTEADRPDLP